MLLMLDPNTAFIDPVFEVPTLVITCDVYDPVTRQPYSARSALRGQQGRSLSEADRHRRHQLLGAGSRVLYCSTTCAMAAAPIRLSITLTASKAGGRAARTSSPTWAAQIPPKRGYFPVPPADTMQDVRSKIVLALEAVGVEIEVHHHEVATAGQAEIDMRFDTLLRMADKVMIYKYIVKNVARKNGLTATFMPKPLFGDNGTGMHVHQSLWKGDKNVFFDEAGYAQLSDTAKYYIGGLLKHCPGLAGVSCADDQFVPPPGAWL